MPRSFNRTLGSLRNMPPRCFSEDLAAYGPDVARTACSLHAAEAYCRRLARRHYENFTVASWLLPKRLRQHFYNLYAYCRWADDLADETASPQESLRLLDWWGEELRRVYRGEAEHPVFVALRETIAEFAIPIEPFQSLLVAFVRDQTQTRYANFDDLCDYCRHSANPVGHLVLYLGRCYNPMTVPLADSICTGLQLANHWQDVARDFARDRIYLPATDMADYGVTAEMLGEAPASLEFCRLLAFEVDRAQSFLELGWPLVSLVPPELKLDVQLFLRGGLATLEAIRRVEYDVLTTRPIVSNWEKLQLLLTAWRGKRPQQEAQSISRTEAHP